MNIFLNFQDGFFTVHCFAVLYTIYPRFLDSGVLWFAEHYFLGD
jgi:hypothetical protein